LRRKLFALVLFAAGIARAQEAPVASTAPSVDPPGEFSKLKDSCGTFKIAGCAEVLFTGQPVHIAVGSIAPQNGFGAGLAYIAHKTTDNWRIGWNVDAVGSNNGSWRTGFYMRLVDTHQKLIGSHKGTKGKVKPNLTELPEHPVINLFAQTISLNKLAYFGLGPATTLAGRSFYGMRETILGVSAVKPDVYPPLNVSIYGEINGRFVNIRPSTGQPSPSIEQLYTEATAPGLTNQPEFAQFGEGIRMRPVRFNDRLHLNYDLAYRQYAAPSNSNFSFQRVTLDISNQIALYSATTRIIVPRDFNGPDECALVSDPKQPGCTVDKKDLRDACLKDNPKKPTDCEAIVRDLQGTVGFRFYISTSMKAQRNSVPFFFQPTIGGADIDGNASLSSYQDFRFRAPNVMLLRENFEHSVWKWPIGIALMADEGKVGLKRGDLSPNPWVHSFSAGLTLRAGGYPQVYLLFSWGGNEGTHTIANVNTSLLGGSARPSLF
jgi:hypothetical protein